MPRLSRAGVKPIAAFCYVWLMLGFFTGTALLLGPVRWMTDALRARGYQQTTENVVMLAVIGIYVLSSALLALWIVRRTARCRTRRVRFAVPTALTLAAAVCLFGWMNPAQLAGAATFASTSVEVGSGAEFVFGPYPDRQRLQQLKREGYTAVISLQHPAVVPFEPAGIATEAGAAQEIGIEFIHAPMLPWVSANDAALNRIREIARTTRGRYYVHCGLGRDRVNLVKRMLELEGTRVAAGEGYKDPRTLDMRVAENRPPFERGRLTEVETDLWLIPYPNKHEFFGNLLSGQIAHATLVLDPDDPAQQRWIDEGRRVFTQYAVPFEVVPYRGDDPARAAEIVRSVRRAPRPAAVIVPYTDPYPSTAVAAALTHAFKDRSQGALTQGER